MTLRASTAAVALPATGPMRAAYGRWHHPQSLVCWASGTKVFLAGLVRALVADGALAWDTPVADLLGASGPGSMTVAALVEHRSGLPRILPEQRPTLPDPYRGWTTARFDERVLPHLDDLAAPDRVGQVEYSNLGYAVLARAVERSQSRDWLDLVRERVVAPLGLPPESVVVVPPEGAEPPDRGVADDGRSYALGSRSLCGRPVPDWDCSTGPFSAAGGLCSTVLTMAQLLRASLDTGGPLAPGDGPHAWQRQGTRAWHAGALLRSGSLLVADVDTGAVAAAHAVGGAPGHGATHAKKALDALLATRDRV